VNIRACAAALTAAVVVALPARAAPVTFTPQFKSGETLQLVLTKTRERQVPNQPAVKGGGETTVTLKVLSAGAEGSVIEWRNGDTRLVGANAQPDAATQDLLAAASGLRYEVVLDAKGDFKELRNFEEVRQRLDQIMEKTAGRVQDEKRREQVKEALRKAFADRQTLEQAVLKEVLLFFYPLGKTLEQGKPLRFDTEMQTPLGPKPIPAAVTVTLKSFNKGMDTAKIEWKQQIDRKAANQAMRQWLEQMGKQMGKPMPKDQKIPDLDVTDRADFVVSPGSGWTESMRYTRKIAAPGVSETQALVIERKR
jgi:hypothetical protein